MGLAVAPAALSVSLTFLSTCPAVFAFALVVMCSAFVLLLPFALVVFLCSAFTFTTFLQRRYPACKSVNVHGDDATGSLGF